MLLFNHVKLTVYCQANNQYTACVIYLTALLAGALLALGFAPFEWRAFSIVSPAFLFALLAVVPLRRAFLVGYVYGLGAFGCGVSWIYNSLYAFGGAHPVVAFALTAALIAVMALYFGLMAWLNVRYLRTSALSLIFMFVLQPFAWFVMEWFRSWFLTGFPWLLLGYSQVDTYLSAYMPLIGITATAIPVCMMSAGLATCIIGREAQRLWGLGLAAFVFVLSVLLYPLDWVEPSGEHINIAIVQGSVDQKVKMNPAKVDVSLDTYLNLTRVVEGAELVIWPETAIPDFQVGQAPYLKVVKEVLQKKNADLITGIFYYSNIDKRAYNSLLLLDTDQEDVQNYFKQRLVPFGEYLPLRQIMNIFSAWINIPIADLYPASVKQVPMRIGDTSIGASICYESAYSSIFRQQLPQANIFINVSNDAWFGHSLAPYQHLEILQARAIETGRYMVRSTNTGISTFINEKGQVGQHLGLQEVGVLNSTVPLLQGSTPFVKLPYIMPGIVFLIFILFIYRERKR